MYFGISGFKTQASGLRNFRGLIEVLCVVYEKTLLRERFTMLRVRNGNGYKSWSSFSCISTVKMLKAGKLEEESYAVRSVWR